MTEYSSLWLHYLTNSLDVCVKKYALQCIEDSDIKLLFQQALGRSEEYIKELKNVFERESLPLPIGYSESDVRLDAPRLFTDNFWLMYMYIMISHGISGYSTTLTTVVRSDIRDFYMRCIKNSFNLYDSAIDLLLEKGLYFHSPEVITNEPPTFVDSKQYYLNMFGFGRKLNAIELNSLTFNLKKSIIAKSLVLGFAQVTSSEEIRSLLLKGVDRAQKHIDIFSLELRDSDAPVPPSTDSEVLPSKTSPFSDKLMMNHVGFLLQASLSYYGATLSSCARSDVIAHCTKAIADNLIEATSWLNVMIDNRWLERPPQLVDRKEIE